MTEYLLAQYYRDPIRREPKNVGVIVLREGRCAAQFLGETGNGDVDLRMARWAREPRIYRKWVKAWREEIDRGFDGLHQRLTEDQSGNFAVITGGKVGNAYGTRTADICANLFPRLVTVTIDTDDDTDDDDAGSEGMPIKEMYREITREFRERGLLAEDARNPPRHPIYGRTPVVGKRATHKPSYQQRGARLEVMEIVNFNTPRKGPAKDHAAWVAKMFDDIRDKEADAAGIAIVRATEEDLRHDTVKYAMDLLEGSVQEIVYRSVSHQWEDFLSARQVTAFASGA